MVLASVCAPLLPGAPAPASRHPNVDRGVLVPASLAASGRRAFPGCPVFGRGQEQQAPGSAVHSAFPGLLKCPIDRALPLPAGRWALLADPLEASGDREP